MIFYLFFHGCCNNLTDPILQEPLLVKAEQGESLTYLRSELVVDSTLPPEDLVFELDLAAEIDVEITDDAISLSPTENWEGNSMVSLTAIDKCDASATIEFEVQFGSPSENQGECTTRFTYQPYGTPNQVYISGSFNDWNAEEYQLSLMDDGSYQIDISLPVGPHTYKFIEAQSNAPQQWHCDPTQEMYQCDEGQDWQPDCSAGNSCNSMIVVQDCTTPILVVEDITRNESTVSLSLSYDGAANIEDLEVSLNMTPIETPEWNGQQPITLEIPNLSNGRNTIRAIATDSDNRTSETVQIPIWNDEYDWKTGTMYFAFVDRFHNGDPTNDDLQGASWDLGDYLGGDWQGLIDKLDYLESTGVTAIWLTAPQNNPQGVFEGKCGFTLTGYHGYWPVTPTGLEEHFGDQDLLKELIAQSHERGIRVLVDWVGNHVHNEHPYFAENPQWFTDMLLCDQDDNWNRAPETCWFAPYLPTVRYYDHEPIHQMVEDAIEFAKEYNIDGYRVDAVKHIPKAVHHNFQHRIEQEFEYRYAGGDFQFYTIGETFSEDLGLLNSYVSPTMLDGQFDFSIYWGILRTLARYESPLYSLQYQYEDSKAVFGDSLMSNFLGNHDVERFISHANGEVNNLYGDGPCQDGNWRPPAESPQESYPYLRLKMAWTWLLTQSDLALIYYGDEIGLSGYHDPDNRKLMRFGNDLSSNEQDVLEHVQKLGQIRMDYGDIFLGEATIWWGEPDPDALVIAKSSASGHGLIVINRSDFPKEITNGLSWANLPSTGKYVDQLTGAEFTPNGDNLTLQISPLQSHVLIWEE